MDNVNEAFQTGTVDSYKEKVRRIDKLTAEEHARHRVIQTFSKDISHSNGHYLNACVFLHWDRRANAIHELVQKRIPQLSLPADLMYSLVLDLPMHIKLDLPYASEFDLPPTAYKNVFQLQVSGWKFGPLQPAYDGSEVTAARIAVRRLFRLTDFPEVDLLVVAPLNKKDAGCMRLTFNSEIGAAIFSRAFIKTKGLYKVPWNWKPSKAIPEPPICRLLTGASDTVMNGYKSKTEPLCASIESFRDKMYDSSIMIEYFTNKLDEVYSANEGRAYAAAIKDQQQISEDAEELMERAVDCLKECFEQVQQQQVNFLGNGNNEPVRSSGRNTGAIQPRLQHRQGDDVDVFSALENTISRA